MGTSNAGYGLLSKVIVLVIFMSGVLFFQNCSSSKVGFEGDTSLGSSTADPSNIPSSAPSCVLPWGKEIQSGEKQIAYEAAAAASSAECVSQERVCDKGQLSGSFAFETCTKKSNANDCLSPWGGGASIPNGTSVTTFAAASVPVGGSCSSQVRTCTNGVLSGSNSYSSQSCSIDYGLACFDYALTCGKATESCTGAQCTYSGCGLTTYVVPNGVSTLTVKMWGAGGAGNSAGDGGAGGFVKGTLAVTSGQVLEIGVAQSGCAGGGGGASFVREKSSKSLYLVAGGGGGGGSDGDSGKSGNNYSGVGACNESIKAAAAPIPSASYGNIYGRVDGGTSGTSTAGGSGGAVLMTSTETQYSIPTAGNNGSFMSGGAAIRGTNPPSPTPYLPAQFEVGGRGAGSNGSSGGGGAGYYGGGSGAGRYTYFGAGGGGGSCYFNGKQLLEKTPGAGKNPAVHSDDPSLTYKPGQGGSRYLTNPTAQVYEGTRGANGAVVISY